MHSYPKIYNVGHREVKNILDHAVVVQEKVDGSQFSFGIKDGELWARSKGAEIDIADPQKLFAPAVTWCIENVHALVKGWTYRGEALCKPKHNTLEYERVPKAGFVLFDIDMGQEEFGSSNHVKAVAESLDLEYVPSVLYAQGTFTEENAQQWLNRTSMFGKTKVEGFVIKAYGVSDSRGKTLMAKHVSENFKAQHIKDWNGRNPNTKDFNQKLGEDVGGPLRWEKAVQHLRDDGKLDGSPKDISPLLKEINQDIEAEEIDRMKDELFKQHRRAVLKAATQGFPQWYKEQLLKEQFND